jgi:hypothetical protein
MSIDQEALRQELVTALHLESLSEEKQETLLSKMGEVLLKRIFLETMEKIGDQGVVEYEALLDKEAGQQEIEAFFESRIPGYNIFVEEVVKKFKDEMQQGIAA